MTTFALGAVDGDDTLLAGRATAAPRDGKWDEGGHEGEDRFDEKTVVSGTILTHFRVNVRLRSATEDLGFAAVLGDAQGMHNVDGPDASVPELVTFDSGTARGVASAQVGASESPAIVSGIAILSVSRSRCAF